MVMKLDKSLLIKYAICLASGAINQHLLNDQFLGIIEMDLLDFDTETQLWQNFFSLCPQLSSILIEIFEN